jgi:hypothetical protein
MRRDGRKASFSEQLARTFNMAATDWRDRVYALLAVSNFTKAPVTIVADYTKTHAQVSIEATTFIVKEAFHVYVSKQLWRRQLQSQAKLDDLPSWAPTLDTLGAWDSFQERGSLIDARYAFSMFSRSGPVTVFSNNLRILHTVGCFMGVVIPRENGGFITDRGYIGSLHTQRISVPEGRRYFLVELFGIRAPFVLEQASRDPPTYSIVGFATVDYAKAGYFWHWSIGIKDEELGTDGDILAEDEREELVNIALV